MKADIHPDYHVIDVKMTNGDIVQMRSTYGSEGDTLNLEIDPSVQPDASGWAPQRFELVSSTPPVPPGLATGAAAWYTARDQEDTLDFSAMDGSQGVTRGVFELRPTGQRERVMARLGLLANDDALLVEDRAPDSSTQAEPSWTLWWRPILGGEGEQLLSGLGPFPDTDGGDEERRARLAGAVPLLRGVERCVWELYKGDEFITEHYGLSMSDLPAYAQFEVVLTNGQYASWMFEIDWIVGEDPSTDPGAGVASDDQDADDQPDDADGPGGGPGDGPGGRRPPGGQMGDDRRRTFDLSGDS